VDRHRPSLGRAAARSLWIAVPVGFLGLFFVYPLGAILDAGLRPEGELRLAAIGDVLGDRDLLGVVWFTVWQAAVSTALTLAIGLPGAYALSRLEFRGRRLLNALVLVPFVLPTVVVGTAFAFPDRSLAWLFAAHVFFNVAVVVRVVGGAWAHVDPELEDAAAGLGAYGIRRFTAVLLPLARPAIAGAAVLVYLFTFASFGVVLLLGGPGRTTIEVEIFRHTSQLLDLETAAVLALLQLAVVSILLWAGAVAESRVVEQRAIVAPPRHPRTAGERAFLVVALAVLAAFTLLPPARLVWRSFSGTDGWTLAHYSELGSVREGSALAVSALGAIGNSVLFAAGATAVALLAGLPAAFMLARTRRARWLRVLAGLPLGVSAVTVGFGFVVAFDQAPLDLRASAWLVPLAQAVVAIPFVVRIVAPAVASIETDLTESAQALGASSGRVFRDVTLPLAAPAILGAAVFAFVISLGEFGATAFLARVDRPTMPIAIFRLLGQPGSASLGQATAMSVLLMGVTAAAAFAFDRIRVGAFGRV
jgi:thiamine transport system permease protein